MSIGLCLGRDGRDYREVVADGHIAGIFRARRAFGKLRGVGVPEDRTMSNSLYEQDFYAWANEQAALLRAGKFESADIANIAEEIESMGRSERRELINRLAVLLLHLLKWRYQPSFRSASWRATVREQRLRLDGHLSDNPSLKSQIDPAMRDAYRLARVGASRETGLEEDTFPSTCPFTFDQTTAEDFWPD
jgi:hypothetical protein